MQAVAEMLVKNESRIKFSTAMTTFRRASGPAHLQAATAGAY